MPSIDFSKDDLQRLHGPMLYITGTKDIMMYRRIGCAIAVILGICCYAALPVQATAQEKISTPDVRELRAVYVFSEKVYVEGSFSIGESKYGGRNIVPILGGSFEGPNIKGEVLPGGADWQLKRPDGDTELCARYTLKTDDGYYIQVTNKVLEHAGASGRYQRSVINFEAPVGSPYEWMNHAIFVGSMGMGDGPPPGKGEGGGAPQQGNPPQQGSKFGVTIHVYKLL